MTMTLADKVNAYLALRDKLHALNEEHKKREGEIKEVMARLERDFMTALDETGLDSLKAPSGTVYRSTRGYASAADPKTFFDFAMSTGRFELMDIRPNTTEVAAYIEATGEPPPGVTYRTVVNIHVRKS
jgi:hypothetical protein